MCNCELTLPECDSDFCFVSSGDSSMVLSMEMNGVVYQGVLFAQPKAAQV